MSVSFLTHQSARIRLWLLIALTLVCTINMVSADVSSSATFGTTVTRDSQAGISSQSELQSEESTSASNVVARFFFIRHGETLANRKGLVLGQTNSPLTAAGEQQARILGRSETIAGQDFWRKYTSDLGRAQQTANLILGERESLRDLGVLLEPRLREVAKGVREMYPKTLNYEQATNRFVDEHGPDDPFPLLESEEEVVTRVFQWMFEVVRDAIQEYRLECQAGPLEGPKVYPIFAVSHSATLRAIITRLVRDDLPQTINFDPVGRDGAQKGALHIPNTSVTIIDVFPHNMDDEVWDSERQSQKPTNPSLLWDAKLKTLTWTPDYQDA